MFNIVAIEEVKKFKKIQVNKDLSSNKIIGIKEIKDFLEQQSVKFQKYIWENEKEK